MSTAARLLLICQTGLFASGLLAESAVRAIEHPSPLVTTPEASPTILPGVVEPVQIVHLMPRVEGVVQVIHVDEGQYVAKGDVLAELDDDIAESSVAVARAMAESQSEIRMAETNWQQSQRLVERVKQAHGSGASSDLELDQAVSAAEQAEFRLSLAREQHRQANAQLQLELTKLASHRVVAPFDGRILKIACRPGQTVARTEVVLTVASLKSLQADLYIPIPLVAQLQVGHDYELLASAPVDGLVRATLTSIEPQIDPASQTSRCRFRIDNANEHFPAGFTVVLQLQQVAPLKPHSF